MLIVDQEKIRDIPLLHVVEQTNIGKPLPFIIFIHGFTSAKEHNLHYAYYLAEKGFRVVLPEANFHGERSQGLDLNELGIRFWDIVLQTIEEVSGIKDAFVERELVNESRIGLAGTSMGGIVTLGALTQYPWINTAVSLMGSPTYRKYAEQQLHEVRQKGFEIPYSTSEIHRILESLYPYDLSQHPEKLEGRPLMFWHGKKDPIVPFQNTYDFYLSIQDQYKEHPEDLYFMGEKMSGHKVSRAGTLELVNWFSEKL
ncbi:fermentation-respiration switch protein FrsA (DUF1100 family) [Oikeobacillus pervagus]|uniref:Fermentation-respiration switch protein FrsA (DUF1100 family) n=1 Tax=Oikeobacillus pervagus TaxID=1325931 RepID=A0AAJ1T4N4_9BACI|nr:prolyl oligopeptidase family serine peptidase [Oikeobacillus pervagus]MDQ0216697.1 fermentation-respiration switch protein FrsA (DUF1100 family) [Oikeobacillus pervagus]